MKLNVLVVRCFLAIDSGWMNTLAHLFHNFCHTMLPMLHAFIHSFVSSRSLSCRFCAHSQWMTVYWVKYTPYYYSLFWNEIMARKAPTHNNSHFHLNSFFACARSSLCFVLLRKIVTPLPLFVVFCFLSLFFFAISVDWMHAGYQQTHTSRHKR